MDNRKLHEAAMAAKRFHDAALKAMDNTQAPHYQTMMRGRLIELSMALDALDRP